MTLIPQTTVTAENDTVEIDGVEVEYLVHEQEYYRTCLFGLIPCGTYTVRHIVATFQYNGSTHMVADRFNEDGDHDEPLTSRYEDLEVVLNRAADIIEYQ